MVRLLLMLFLLLSFTIVFFSFSRASSRHYFFSSIGHSVWIGLVDSIVPVLGSPVLNMTFLDVPMGMHTVFFYLYCVVVNGTIVFLLRLVVGSLPPFMFLYFMILSILFSEYFYRVPFFTHQNERDGIITKYSIEPMMKYPREKRFDPKIRKEASRISDIGNLTFVFTRTSTRSHIHLRIYSFR